MSRCRKRDVRGSAGRKKEERGLWFPGYRGQWVHPSSSGYAPVYLCELFPLFGDVSPRNAFPTTTFITRHVRYTLSFPPHLLSLSRLYLRSFGAPSPRPHPLALFPCRFVSARRKIFVWSGEVRFPTWSNSLFLSSPSLISPVRRTFRWKIEKEYAVGATNVFLISKETFGATVELGAPHADAFR